MIGALLQVYYNNFFFSDPTHLKQLAEIHSSTMATAGPIIVAPVNSVNSTLDSTTAIAGPIDMMNQYRGGKQLYTYFNCDNPSSRSSSYFNELF